MICKYCGGENVTFTSEQVSTKASENVMQPIMKFIRVALIICTCGLWLIVPKFKFAKKTKIQYREVAICQTCGKKWRV